MNDGAIDVVSGNAGLPIDAAGDVDTVWESGDFNPATSTVAGYPDHRLRLARRLDRLHTGDPKQRRGDGPEHRGADRELRRRQGEAEPPRQAELSPYY